MSYERTARWKAKKRAEGFCGYCFKVKAVPGMSKCAPCREQCRLIEAQRDRKRGALPRMEWLEIQRSKSARAEQIRQEIRQRRLEIRERRAAAELEARARAELSKLAERRQRIERMVELSEQLDRLRAQL